MEIIVNFHFGKRDTLFDIIEARPSWNALLQEDIMDCHVTF